MLVVFFKIQDSLAWHKITPKFRSINTVVLTKLKKLKHINPMRYISSLVAFLCSRRNAALI